MQGMSRSGVVWVAVMLASVLALAPQASAGGKDPSEILGECDVQIEAIAEAAAEEMAALAIEAEAELETLYFDQASPSRLFRAAASYVSKVEKIESKARAKINKLANKYEARLTRANASDGFFDDLDALVDTYLTAVSLSYFDSVTAILDSLGDWIFPV